MRCRSDTSDGEFEDALDSLPYAVPSSSRQYDGDTTYASSSSGTRHLGFPVCGNNSHITAAFPSTSATASFKTDSPPIRLTATRHGRLEQLRSRMRQEFGQPSAGSEDTASECTSLASWGRNLLMEQQPIGDTVTSADVLLPGVSGCPTVRPIDSISTRPTPVSLRPFRDGSELGVKESERNPPSYFLFDLFDQLAANSMKSDDTRPVNNRGTHEINNVSSSLPREEEMASISRQQSDDRRLSLSPPVHPPPPLPRYLSRDESQGSSDGGRESGQNLQIVTHRPPPLPPRRAAAALPSALLPGWPPQQQQRPEIIVQPTKYFVDSEECEKTRSSTRRVNNVETKKSAAQPPPMQLQQSNSLSPKRNASKSHATENGGYRFVKNPTFFDDYGMRLGHAKTNSLDRGLSLAKCMMSGPFPPPASSKSSSLKRDVTPADVTMAACDEETHRNNTAHGVIQQLAFSVLSSASAEKADKRIISDEGLTVVGEEIASASSSTSIPTLLTNPKSPALSTPHYENLTIINDMSNNVKAMATKEPNGNVYIIQPLPLAPDQLKPDHCDSLSVGHVADDENASEKQRIQKSNSLPRDSSKGSTLSLRKAKTLNRMESIDPVTRDVQRRMSLSSADSSHADGASTSTGIGQVRSVVRSYGAAAVGFLRGAVRRSRTAVASTPISRVLAARGGGDYDHDEDEAVGNLTDSGGEDEAATSISESFPSASVGNDAKMALPSSTAASMAPEVICRPRNTKKGPFDFEQLRLVQELGNEHTGAVWCVKFSVCGRLFATGGQDNIIRVWVLKNYVNYFTRMRERYSRDADSASSNNLQDKLSNFMFMNDHGDIGVNEHRNDSTVDSSSLGSPSGRTSVASTVDTDSGGGTGASLSSGSSSILVMQKPFCVFRGHTADVLDLSWSPRNYFILSCGIDRTVKLWHLTRNECLCCFQHMDFVTCIAFMPKDDRYFISGCMDGKIRLWHIPEKKVALWNEVEQSKFITAITFVRNAKFVVVGTYNGRCFFYTTDQLRYHTVIDVRSSRSQNAHGHKITSLAVHGDKLLITSNDSRIRMYDLRDMNLTRKFKGSQIERSQIRASFSPDGRHIISGSEDNYIYIWRTGELPPSISVRKDRNPMWERARAHNSVVTAAVFAPKPGVFFPAIEPTSQPQPYQLGREEAVGRNGRSASIASSSGLGLETSTTASSSVHNRLLELSSGPHIRTTVPLSTTFTSSLLSNSLLRNRHNNNVNENKSARGTRKVGTSDAGTMSARASIAGGVCLANSSGGVETFANVIVSADVSGSLKIFVNPAPLKAGGSSFFPQ